MGSEPPPVRYSELPDRLDLSPFREAGDCGDVRGNSKRTHAKGARVSKRATQARVLAQMRAQRPSTVEVAHHPPAQAPTSFVPGDFSLHRATTNKGRHGATTVLGKLIQAGERARFGDSNFARSRVPAKYGVLNLLLTLAGLLRSTHGDPPPEPADPPPTQR
jgi:hypothetical protein